MNFVVCNLVGFYVTQNLKPYKPIAYTESHIQKNNRKFMNLTQELKNKWFTSNILPEQGKKILCMDRGDFYVAQRFGQYWFSIPFYDSTFSRYNEPELWCEIDFPENYKGYIKILIDDENLTIDEAEKKHPDIYEIFVKGQLELFERKQSERSR